MGGGMPGMDGSMYGMGGMPGMGGGIPGMGGGMPGMGSGIPGMGGGGIPGMGGGMPGMYGGVPQQSNYMDQFMYGINSQIAMATAGPYGGSVVDWARSLAAGQPQGQPGLSSGQPASQSSAGGLAILTQLITMLTQVIAAKVKERANGA